MPPISKELTSIINKKVKAVVSPAGALTLLFLLIAGLALKDFPFLFQMTALAVAVVFVPLAPALTLVFYAIILAFAVPINDVPIVAAGLRVYVADFAFYLLACAGVYVLWNAIWHAGAAPRRKPRLEKWLVVLVVINVAWGCIEVANGILGEGLEVRDAIGDFRRIYLYMLALLIPLGLPIKQWLLQRIPLTFVIGGAGAVLFGLHRIRTGVLYHSFTSHVDSPRVLGDAELVGLCFLLAYAAAFLLSKANPLKKAVHLPLAAIAVAFMVISGWRLGLVFALGAPVCVACAFAYVRGVRLSRIIGAGAATVIVVGLGAVAAFGLLGETADFVWQSRQLRQQDLQGDVRTHAYKAALIEFAQRPVIGTGLGHQLAYGAVASDGAFLMRETTTHNLFIDVLYQTGLIGLGLFLAVHACFALLFLRKIRSCAPGALAVTIGLFVGYIFILGLFCLEPSYVSTMMTMYLTMGLTVKALGEFSVKDAGVEPVQAP